MRVPNGARDWERLGSLEPYFAVLTESRFLRENITPESLAAFHATGEADVSRIAALATVKSGRPFHPQKALEFGCGVGRLTFPMAARAGKVTGVDAAPSLLEIARADASARGIQNVEFLPVEDLESLEPGTFDFIYSYIVFQHIPTAEGETYLGELLRLAAPDATVALHFTLSRAGGPVRRILRALRGRSRLINRLATLMRRDRNLPYMQMNTYERQRIERMLAGEGFDRPTIEPTEHGGVAGGIFVATRSASA